MDLVFDWRSNAPDHHMASVEEKICADQDSGHSLVKFCHPGLVTVTLTPSGLFQDSVVGDIRCSCGKPKGIVSGTIDGSHLVIEAV